TTGWQTLSMLEFASTSGFFADAAIRVFPQSGTEFAISPMVMFRRSQNKKQHELPTSQHPYFVGARDDANVKISLQRFFFSPSFIRVVISHFLAPSCDRLRARPSMM
ncbi:MAG: hypothetical protein ABI905_13500, partial [Betaproteobacteria bacterium]